MDIQSNVLIIIPAYNEAATIGGLVKEIRSKHPFPSLEILVINDGSADNTEAEAKRAGARVVSLPFNLGIGGAVQTGYKIAADENFDVAVQLDGDAQHDPASLSNVVSPVLQDKLDFCIGSRFLNDTSDFKSTFTRRAGIRFLKLLLKLLAGVSLTDPTSGFRAANQKVIREFAAYYPVDFPEPEAVKIAKRFGARIGEVPVNMRKRLGGESSIRDFSTLYYMIKVTLAILIDSLKKKT